MLFAFLLALVSSQVLANESSKSALDLALEKNLSIHSFDKAREAAESKKGFLTRSFYPTLNLELGQENFQTGPYQARTGPYGMLEARFNLFRGGKDRMESELRDVISQSAQYDQELAVRGEINKIRKLQFQLMYNSELITILENELVVNKRIMNQALQRAKSGVTSRTDGLEFTIYESELVEGIESLQHENKILKIGLRPLLGLSEEEAIDVKTILEHQHDDDLLVKKYSFTTHPDVASLDAEVRKLNLQSKMNERWWTPSLDLYGGYYLYTLRDRDFPQPRDRDDTVVGLRLTMELFDARKGSREAIASAYQAESKRLMARYAEKQTAAKFLMLQEDLSHTHEVMHYVLDRIKKSKEYLNLTLKEYDRGVKNSLDALTAVQRYYRYEKQYLDKKKEYQLIKADILSILGE